MSNRNWQGFATAVAQVDGGVMAGIDVGTVITLTMAGPFGVSITHTCASATVSVVLAILETLWNAHERPEAKEVIASVEGTNTLLFTAATPGKPFGHITAEVTNSGTIPIGPITASAGPNDWSTAGNWSGGAVPVSSDTVSLQENAIAIKYGLAQSAVNLTSFRRHQSYTGTVGLPRTNVDDPENSYPEYRATELDIQCALWEVGMGEGEGPSEERYDIGVGTSTMVFNAYATGVPVDDTKPALYISGGSANASLYVMRGFVGTAFYDDQTASFGTIGIHNRGQNPSDTMVVLGKGTTEVAVIVDGGIVRNYAGFTTIVVSGGTVYQSDGTPASIVVRSGSRFVYNTDDTCTAAEVWGPNQTVAGAAAGEIDFSDDVRSVTITTLTRKAGGVVTDPGKRMQWGTLKDEGQFDASLNLGAGHALSGPWTNP
jgi:hypothetical protein